LFFLVCLWAVPVVSGWWFLHQFECNWVCFHILSLCFQIGVIRYMCTCVFEPNIPLCIRPRFGRTRCLGVSKMLCFFTFGFMAIYLMTICVCGSNWLSLIRCAWVSKFQDKT
jgi:hypothetical protein